MLVQLKEHYQVTSFKHSPELSPNIQVLLKRSQNKLLILLKSEIMILFWDRCILKISLANKKYISKMNKIDKLGQKNKKINFKFNQQLDITKKRSLRGIIQSLTRQD